MVAPDEIKQPRRRRPRSRPREIQARALGRTEEPPTDLLASAACPGRRPTRCSSPPPSRKILASPRQCAGPGSGSRDSSRAAGSGMPRTCSQGSRKVIPPWRPGGKGRIAEAITGPDHRRDDRQVHGGGPGQDHDLARAAGNILATSRKPSGRAAAVPSLRRNERQDARDRHDYEDRRHLGHKEAGRSARRSPAPARVKPAAACATAPRSQRGGRARRPCPRSSARRWPGSTG